MIERLQRALEHVDELSPEEQEDIAQLIEERTDLLDLESADTSVKWRSMGLPM